ncbi:M23 family metallopeptidase [Streptomyces sp. HSW2009]|uniref:M23 family metallopeptidase n=1 Tax=Streptomyces sp. HSW2009 TaxID=3142890 RepID=UPI0032EDC3DD
MAFTRATGRHRRPTRFARSSANAAGMATLAATGVVAGIAAPAMAASGADASPELQDTGLRQAVTLNDDIADRIGAQADAQYTAAEQAAAQQQAEEDARQQAAKHAAEVKQKAAEAKRKAAAEEAKKKAAAKKAAEAKAAAEREAQEKASERASQAEQAEQTGQSRASRTTERAAIGSYVSPIAGSYVSTQYKASGANWSSGSHTGIDFHANTGTSVRAVGAGTVVEAGWGGAYGNNVIIKMNDGTYTQYGHLHSLSVSVGQTVAPGEQIGISGSTGNSTAPHLHFEARTSAQYGSDIDPLAYLRSHGVSI